MAQQEATQLAQFAVKTRLEDVPKDVVEFAKFLTLKTVAGTVSGSRHPSGQKMIELIKDRKLPGDVGVTGAGFKTSLWEAVYLESFLSHARELEDDRFNGGISWDITVIPTLLCLADKLKLSGKALTEAMVVGLEVHSRTCSYSAAHRGVHIIPPSVGPAAGAARALGLDEKQTLSAMGLAMSGIPLAIINFGTDAHYFESALQSLQAIMAAEMAQKGMTSNPDLIKYLTDLLGADKVQPVEKMTAGLGKTWAFKEISIKKYPCCFANHRQIDIVIELMKQNGLKYDDVKEVEVHASPAEIFLDRPNPKTEGDLQFSFQHTLGAAMLDGDVNLVHVDNKAINAPRYLEARKKVKMTVNPKWSSEIWIEPARVTVVARDGKKYYKERQESIGSIGEPLTEAQFRALWVKYTEGILAKNQIQKTADAIMGLEKLADIRQLKDTLTFLK